MTKIKAAFQNMHLSILTIVPKLMPSKQTQNIEKSYVIVLL